ncbi:FAD/NAD(P)-binding domain-containing protein [Xylariaceae sp. FL1272]|nr:FAD/NAD(P)-binding domain-containing protein [Xylariaceae sp. FL1272]
MDQMASNFEIAIGGGPAGLTLARLFQNSTINCTVFESAPSRSVRDQGGSLDLHEDPEFVKHARPEGEVLRIISDVGEVLMDEGVREEDRRPQELRGRPEINRSNLLAILDHSLADETMKWGYSFVSVVEEAGRSALALKLMFGNGHTEYCDVVIGADGPWSKVRPLLTDQTAVYTGIAGLDVRILNADTRFPHLSGRCGNGTSLTVGLNRALLSQKNSGGTIRMYAFMRLQQGWEEECDFETPLRLYLNMVLKADIDAATKHGIWALPVGMSWKSHPRIILKGDAAHLMSPFAGAGVNVAMQDAPVLGRNIIEAQKPGGRLKDIAEAIGEYEREMITRANQYAEQSSMYLDLLFNERGAIALVVAFKKMRQVQGNA